MYYFLIIFSLFSVFLFVRSYVVIGNYSQLNPKDCGISRVSTLVDTNCFEWHKGYDSSALKRGKLVGHSDAPWVTFLVIRKENYDVYCTGSVIADKWVITAAHCLVNSIDIKIYLGYNFTKHEASAGKVPYYEAYETYIHPNYKGDFDIWGEYRGVYDLGLIKMKQSINTSAGEHSICLPNKYVEDLDHIINFVPGYEYAMVAGWGSNPMERPSDSLRITETRIWLRLWEQLLRGDSVKLFQVDNQGLCHGDSGSPVWQYHMGRAVIAAVLNNAPIKTGNNCESDNDNRSSIASWVDSEIDWILNVTQLY